MGMLMVYNVVVGLRSEWVIIYYKWDVFGMSDVDGIIVSINFLVFNLFDMLDWNYEVIIEGCVW